MRINIQSLFFYNRQQELQQKLSALKRQSNEGGLQGQQKAIPTEQSFAVLFPVSKKEVDGRADKVYAGRPYGEAFGREAEEQLSDFHKGTAGMLQNLRGAGSAEEALQRLADTKKELMQQVDSVAQRYEAYTGNSLSPYVYKEAKDYAGIKWNSHLIYNRSLDTVKGTELSVNLGEYGKIDLSGLKEAENLINLKA